MRPASRSWADRAAPAVVWATAALAGVHVLDDVLWHVPAGASRAHGLLLALPIVAVILAWSLATLLAPPPLRVFLAFMAAALLLVDFALHLVHAQDSGVSGSDVTGLLLVAPAAALAVLAVATAARPKPRRTLGRRWAARVAVVVAGLAGLALLVMPIALAMTAAHKPAMDVPAASLPPGKAISLRTTDGVRIAATYIPPRTGDVIVILHGSGGDRGGGPVSRARMLIRHGFGVLMYDARGSGESSGRPENLGWTWPRDVAAAVAWLDRRREVRHVGAIGLSTGAEALLDAAAHDRRIDAVVADGTQARQTSELSALPAGLTKVFTSWELLVAQAAYRPLTHAPRPVPLTELIPRIAPRPVMLISATDSFERDMNRGYKREAPDVQLWEPADTGHTKGLSVHPREYERRVIAFFRAAFRR